MPRPNLLFAGISSAALMFAIAGSSACGGDDEDAGPFPGTGDDNNSSQQSGGSGSGSAAAGTFVIDGEKFDVVETRRCEPFGGISGNDAHEDDLDAVARSKSGEYVNLVIGNGPGYGPQGEQFVQQHHELRLSRTGSGGIQQYEGRATHNASQVWYAGTIFPYSDKPMEGGEPLDGAPFKLDGDKISGAMKVTQDWPEGATGVIDVTFNFEVPSKVSKC